MNPSDATELSMKPGWQTTEFYVTLFTALLPVTTMVFHKEFDSAQIQTWATVTAAIASSAYAISRSRSKQEVMKAKAMVTAASTTTPVPMTPAGAQPAPSPTNGAVPNASVPLDMLALILVRLDELTDAQEGRARKATPTGG